MKIFKYTLRASDFQTIQINEPGRILSVEEQNENIVLYAMIDPSGPLKEVGIRIVGTGYPIEDWLFGEEFIGTVKLQGGSFMFHVFQIKPDAVKNPAPAGREIDGKGER